MKPREENTPERDQILGIVIILIDTREDVQEAQMKKKPKKNPTIINKLYMKIRTMKGTLPKTHYKVSHNL